MAVHAELTAITIDSADPRALAEFYRKVTGWDVAQADDDFVSLGQGPIRLAFQRVAGYRGPSWPDTAKHATAANTRYLAMRASAKAMSFENAEGQRSQMTWHPSRSAAHQLPDALRRDTRGDAVPRQRVRAKHGR
ncbi:VOC family protein [Streptomyces sp. NPDC051020]|uniref:VOC family protein n=1 Tax=Streptomyces sp. NPDC051020 TaxID=3155409 RepID=UPI0034372D0A